MGVAAYLTGATPPRLAVGGITVAIPVLAVEQLGDVALGGLLVAAALGPSIVAAPIVGALLDRTRRPGALVAGAGLVVAARSPSRPSSVMYPHGWWHWRSSSPASRRRS